ncbi:MAG: hypothetical protein WCE64_12350 [Bacteroidales bacterium]
MKEEQSQYGKVLEMLRRSDPYMPHYNQVEEKIIDGIRKTESGVSNLSVVTDMVFGWVYIDWVRKGLAGISIILAGFFIFQQAVIIRQVKDLSRQVKISRNSYASVPAYDITSRLMYLKISSQLLPLSEPGVNRDQLEDFIRSYDEMQIKYRDLLKMINEDPALKEYIEKKLNLETELKPDI